MWWRKVKQRAFVDEKDRKKERHLRINYTWIVQHIPFLVFLFGLGLLYIANGHYLVKNVREINKLQVEVKELHWTYLGRKSEWMFKSKMSKISKEVAPYGLEDADVPPLVISEDNEK